MAASDSFVGEHLNPSPYKEALARAELAEAALHKARRDALEEALLVCAHLRWLPEWSKGADECIAAIRALIEREPC